jgi:hypothetical protein
VAFTTFFFLHFWHFWHFFGIFGIFGIFLAFLAFFGIFGIYLAFLAFFAFFWHLWHFFWHLMQFAFKFQPYDDFLGFGDVEICLTGLRKLPSNLQRHRTLDAVQEPFTLLTLTYHKISDQK